MTEPTKPHAQLPEGFIDALRVELRGTVLTQEDAGYDEGRAVYNAMIQRTPGAITLVADAAETSSRASTPRATRACWSRCVGAATMRADSVSSTGGSSST